MALPITIPYTFANVTTTALLSNLDTDFTTVTNAINGIGNGSISLSNVSITGGTISGATISTPSIANGTSSINIGIINGSIVTSTNGNTAITIDTSQNATLVGNMSMSSSFKRNRIINGNMAVNQRNVSVNAVTGTQNFVQDRWFSNVTQNSIVTLSASSSVPGGFTTAISVLTNPATIAAGDYFNINQKIEGLNVGELQWGTASAKTVTLSFWFYSSVTGTFSGSIQNSAADRSYVFAFSIPTANTWTYSTITIPGDTTGTWLKTTGVGLVLSISLGTGATYQNTSGSWYAGNYLAAAGSATLSNSTNSTFRLTGVQLEVGSIATPYEFQIYSDQLAQCQRYLPAWNYTASTIVFGLGQCNTTTQARIHMPFKVSTRVAPTGISIPAISNFYIVDSTYTSAGTLSSLVFLSASTENIELVATTSSGLTAGQITQLLSNTSTAYIFGTGCEL